jgi:hypothetical protein
MKTGRGKKDYTEHQFSMFGWQKPVAKVPISAERIAEVKKLIGERKGEDAAKVLREVREGLENYERRISSKPPANKGT